MQLEIAAERLQVCEKANKILQTAAETIDRPGRDHVDLARGGILEQPIETRPLVATLAAADAGILIEADHLPT